MHLPQLNIQNRLTLTHCAAAQNPLILSEIYKPEHNIAIWQRQLTPELTAEVAQFVEHNPDLSVNACIKSSAIVNDVSNALATYPSSASLQNNIVELVDMFCCLFELNRAGLRLQVLTHAMCPRFHVDRVPCRLVTTYVGQGSEWLPHPLVNRQRLGAGNNGLSDEESGLYAFSEAIQTLNTADVALLKGEAWLGNENAGLVHRSPFVRAGEKRLLLTLDFIG